MKTQSRVLAVALCFVMVVSLAGLAVPVRAVGAAMTAAEIFSSMWGVYASSVGLSQSFKTDGQMNSLSNPYSQAQFSSDMSGLYSEYQSSISGNQSLSDWASWALDRMSVGAAPSVGTVYRMTSDLVEFFDGFASWVLEEKLNLTRDASGHYNSSGTWFDNTIASAVASGGVSISSDTLKPYSTNATERYQNAFVVAESSSRFVGIFADKNNKTGLVDLFPFVVNGTWYVASTINFYAQGWRFVVADASKPYSGASVTDLGYSKTFIEDPGYYLFYIESNMQVTGYTWRIPEYSSIDSALASIAAIDSPNTSIQLRPKDKYNELDIPDVSDAGYLAKEKVGTISSPWDDTVGSLAAALSNALEWVNEKIRANVDILEDSVAGDPAAEAILSNDPSDYLSVGLADVFPFCLPFDLYNFFECLAADPVAPSFEVPIEFPPLDLTYTFEIDLSEFNDVAALLRKLELLGFCVALILITRQKMIRG